MSNKPNTRLIGAFVVGAVTLIVVIFLVFGSGKLYQNTYDWVIFFRGNINGLKVGAPVKVKGVEIGSVKNIRGLLDENGEVHVEVIVETIDAALDAVKEWAEQRDNMPIEEFMEWYIDRGFRAQLQSQSMLTGQLYISWDFFPDTPIILTGLNPDYIEIPSVPTTIEQIEMQLQRGLNSLHKVPVDDLTRSLLLTLQGIDSLVRSPEVYSSFADLSASLKESVKLMKSLEKQIDPVSGSMQATSGEMNKTLNRMEDLLMEIQLGMANDRYEMHMALRQFAEANRSLKHLADYLQKNPRSLIFGKE
jgi:paraquat-inducible protein B